MEPDPQCKRSLADLPYDLEREIFDLTARAYPGFAPQLALVCKYVQKWVEAVMYESIVLGSSNPKQALFWRTFSARPPSFFAQTIRILHLATGVSYHRARSIITVCTNLSSLTCWANPLNSREEFCALLSPHLRRLSINTSILWSPTRPITLPNLSHPLFSRLTHLEVVNPPCWFDWSPFLEHGALPSLTHLAFGDLDASHASASPNIIDFFKAALESDVPGPRLEMLIAVSQNETFLCALECAGLEEGTEDSGSGDRGRGEKRDGRFVCLPSYHHPLGPADYWNGVALREMGFWSAAASRAEWERGVKGRRVEGV